MESVMSYSFLNNSKIIFNNTITKLLSSAGNLIYKASVLKDRFFNNFYLSPEPISMIVGSNVILTIFYLLYFITHGSLIRYIIETIFNILYAVVTINAIQLSIIYSVLDILYYFRTSKFLLREIYDSYNLKNNLKIGQLTITYNIFILGSAFIAYVYPLILYMVNKENINFISGLLSIFPLMILSMYATSGETFFCNYSVYIKKIDKQISKEESFLCNTIVIIVSLFLIGYFN
tara:strand:- start:1381 stop:2079 length:699 start_codon:yes stop_codon:yes gene_type:complete